MDERENSQRGNRAAEMKEKRRGGGERPSRGGLGRGREEGVTERRPRLGFRMLLMFYYDLCGDYMGAITL